jgi:hypothetical protein
LYVSPERVRIAPRRAPSISVSPAWRTVVGVGARSVPLRSWVWASARQPRAAASVGNVLRIGLPSFLDHADAW